MPPIKALLVDDEADSLETLQLLLARHCPDVQILAALNDPRAAIKKIKALQPALLFLDVQMPGMTGFDLLGKLKDFSGRVIFVTAHSDFALRAIKFSALDYLLKPVDATELKKAVQKFSKAAPASPPPGTYRQAASNIDFMAQPNMGKIALNTQQGVEILKCDEIIYLQADRSYTHITFSHKKPLLIAKPLKDFEEVMPAAQFMRIHASYIINLSKIQRYMRAEGGYVVMEDGKEITVSRSHKDAFLQYLEQ